MVQNLGISLISKTPARLLGYRRVCIKNVGYPVAVEGGKEDFIDGEIHEVDSFQLKVLDEYEDL